MISQAVGELQKETDGIAGGHDLQSMLKCDSRETCLDSMALM